MSKIFEALEHARLEANAYDDVVDDEFTGEGRPELVEPEEAVVPEPIGREVILDLNREPVPAETEPEDGAAEEPVSRETHPPMDYRFDVEDAIFALYQRINALLPTNARRIIQFIGPQGEEDVSSIARGYAYVAVKSGQSVLLIEGDQKNHNQKRFFNILDNTVSWMNTANNKEMRSQAIQQIGDLPLYVGTSSNSKLTPPQIALPKAFEAFVRDIGQAYDLLVVDSSPIQRTNDGLLLSSMMDGVVLVVEANRTLSNAAEDIKNRILSNGGNLLGVVLSRERHYVPGLLAKNMLSRQRK